MTNPILYRATAAKAALVLFGLTAMSWPALADETLKVRTVSHSTSTIFVDAADGVEGHIVGSARFVGISFYEDGRVGRVAYLANFDYVKGSGAYETYMTVTFDDGSTLRQRNTGMAVTKDGVTTFPDGRIEILGGTGRYANASGSGTFSGMRVLPIADGGDGYYDGTIEIRM